MDEIHNVWGHGCYKRPHSQAHGRLLNKRSGSGSVKTAPAAGRRPEGPSYSYQTRPIPVDPEGGAFGYNGKDISMQLAQKCVRRGVWCRGCTIKLTKICGAEGPAQLSQFFCARSASRPHSVHNCCNTLMLFVCSCIDLCLSWPIRGSSDV